MLSSYRITEKEVYRLPITNYKNKLNKSISWGAFLAGSELDLSSKESKEIKVDKEYEYLKSIGAI